MPRQMSQWLVAVRTYVSLAGCLSEQRVSPDQPTRPKPPLLSLGQLCLGCIWGLLPLSLPSPLSLLVSVLGPGPKAAHGAFPRGPSLVLGAWGSRTCLPWRPLRGGGTGSLPTFSFSPLAHFVWSLLVVFESPVVSGKALPVPRAPCPPQVPLAQDSSPELLPGCWFPRRCQALH